MPVIAMDKAAGEESVVLPSFIDQIGIHQPFLKHIRLFPSVKGGYYNNGYEKISDMHYWSLFESVVVNSFNCLREFPNNPVLSKYISAWSK